VPDRSLIGQTEFARNRMSGNTYQELANPNTWAVQDLVSVIGSACYLVLILPLLAVNLRLWDKLTN
jgi:hypothetical protein